MRKFFDIIPPEQLKKETPFFVRKRVFGITLLKKSLRAIAIKIICLLLVINLSWIGFSAALVVPSYFNDIENSNINTYQAGTLDFHLDSPTDNFIPLGTVLNMSPGDLVTREISIINNGPFQYSAWTVKAGGDDDFCNALELKAELEGIVVHSDGLMNFNLAAPIIIGDDGQDDWLFTVILPSGSFSGVGQVCQIKFVFDGWQLNFLDSSLGFSDQEEIGSFFISEGIKINKVYYDVLENQHCKESKNEWVELYNGTDLAVGLKNWEICHGYDEDAVCNRINSNTIIPALGFAAVGHDNSTWVHCFPNASLPTIHQLGGFWPELGNDGDYIVLKNPSGAIVDCVSWGNDPNTCSFSDGPITGVDEGHILGRIVAGLDTNQASDWKDLGLPDVEVIVPNGGEIWYVGRTYALKWIATNPNGLDSELSIDIWYSGDSGNIWANIVTGTENDGVYDWRIPFLIDGYYFAPSEYARIKVVATGPENLMVQDWDMSDDDFCPPIDFSLLTLEEIEQAKAIGLIQQQIVPEQTAAIEPAISENSSIEENNIEDITAMESAMIEDKITEGSVIEETTTIEGEPAVEEVEFVEDSSENEATEELDDEKDLDFDEEKILVDEEQITEEMIEGEVVVDDENETITDEIIYDKDTESDEIDEVEESSESESEKDTDEQDIDDMSEQGGPREFGEEQELLGTQEDEEIFLLEESPAVLPFNDDGFGEGRAVGGDGDGGDDHDNEGYVDNDLSLDSQNEVSPNFS